MLPTPPSSPLFPYTTLFRSPPKEVTREDPAAPSCARVPGPGGGGRRRGAAPPLRDALADDRALPRRPHRRRRGRAPDRKSTRLNSSHLGISYAVFCLKKKK